MKRHKPLAISSAGIGALYWHAYVSTYSARGGSARYARDIKDQFYFVLQRHFDEPFSLDRNIAGLIGIQVYYEAT